jgi:tRNA(fMet)-specific endonuclease VapC
MTGYLLDSSPITAYLLGRQGAVQLIAPWIARREAVTSVLVYGEVVEYLRSMANFAQRVGQLQQLLVHVTPHGLTYPIMERYADIRRTLRPIGQLIGDVNTLIAATALEHDLTVVTVDSDFQRVPALQAMLVSPAQLR